jgi:DNA-binding transcriptional MerR regulator
MTPTAQSTAAESFTIQDVAKRSGFSEPTLRYYEKIGLIEAIPRDRSSGHRRYSAGTLQAIEALACLRACGLSIDEMRTYLQLLAQGRAAATAQRTLFERHAARLAEEMARLRIRQRYIESKVQLWAARERDDPAAEARVTERVRQLAQELR